MDQIPSQPAHGGSTKTGSHRRRGTLALLGAVAIWGSTFILTKFALQEAGPFTITFLRFLIGLAVLWPFARRQGFRPSMCFQPTYLRFGLIGIALFYGLQNLGLQFTTAGNASLIEASVPAASALASFLLLRERLPRARLAGVALTVLGVALVSGARPAGGGSQALLGNLLVLGAVVSFALYAVQGKKLAAGGPATVSTAASFGAGLLFLAPALVGELALSGPPHLSALGWLNVVYLGCAASALTLFLWNYALQYMEMSAAALYTSLVPIVGLGLALLLGESASAAQLIGGALAVAGVWVGDSLASTRPKPGADQSQ